jgi:putative redox protein
MNIRTERIEFPSRSGSLLIGELHRDDTAGRPVLLLCHGMESTRSGTKQQAIVERFVPQGFSVLRFDFGYVGESEGNFEDLTMSGEVADTLGALDFLRDFETGPVVVVGSSFGGAVALLTAAQDPSRIHAVATMAAVGDTALFTDRLSEADIAEWRRTDRREWGDSSFLKASFLRDVEQLDISDVLSSLTQPLLLMHGEADEVVPPSHATLIESAAAGDVTVVMFPGVGHRFDEPGALESLLDTLDDWLGRVVCRA